MRRAVACRGNCLNGVSDVLPEERSALHNREDGTESAGVGTDQSITGQHRRIQMHAEYPIPSQLLHAQEARLSSNLSQMIYIII